MKNNDIIFLYDTNQRFCFTGAAFLSMGLSIGLVESCDIYLAAFRLDERHYKLTENYKIAFKSFAGNKVPSKTFYINDLTSILSIEIADNNNPGFYRGFYKVIENKNNDYNVGDLVCVYVDELDIVNVLEILKVRTNWFTKLLLGKYRIKEQIPTMCSRNTNYISNVPITDNGKTISKTVGFILRKLSLVEDDVTCCLYFAET